MTGATGTGNFLNYDESPISYDANGNLESLTRRYNNTPIDQLSYLYRGNQLHRVNDSQDNQNQAVKGFINGANADDEFVYDGNGNLVRDFNRGIGNSTTDGINYNVLNLPRRVVRNTRTVQYTYDANGVKLKSEAPDNVNTYYAGTFEYRAENSLLRIGVEEGQIVKDGTNSLPQYYLRDHLGNVRSVVDETGNVIQETEYYAFGLPIQRTGSDKNKYLYNGKEKQPETEWLDYGARMYDPTIGRWGVVDPLAELDLNLSLYNYVYDNPISNVDPLGMHPDSAANYAPGAIVENNTGKWEYLGDGKWKTIWEASSNSTSFGLNPLLSMNSEQNSVLNPDNGIHNSPFSWASCLDGVNKRSGAVSAAGALIKNYPNFYRSAGRYTVQYWSKVRQLGKSFQMAQTIDKMANVKVRGIPGLGLVNAVVELSNLRDAASKRVLRASDIGGAAFSVGIGFVAFANPIAAAGMAIYVIADYSGVLDLTKAHISQKFDAAFDSKFQDLTK